MDEQPLELYVTRHGDSSLIRVRGEVDMATAPQLRECIFAASAGGERVDLDFADTTFMDSTGLGCVVLAHRDLEADGVPVQVVAASPQVAGVLRLAGAAEMLGLPPD